MLLTVSVQACAVHTLASPGKLLTISLVFFLVEASVAVTVLSIIGKFFISAAWNVIMVWQTEVYPTTLRCTLSAMNGVVGRIGTVTAPYMVDLVCK